MQGIYHHIPEIKYVSRVHNIAAILCLQRMLHVMLFPIKNRLYFYSNISAQYGCFLHFLDVMLSRYVIQVIFLMILRWLQLQLLVSVSFLRPTCSVLNCQIFLR
jgi:hypothetical protein